jgi:hypothetical protein
MNEIASDGPFPWHANRNHYPNQGDFVKKDFALFCHTFFPSLALPASREDRIGSKNWGGKGNPPTIQRSKKVAGNPFGTKDLK